MTISPTKTAVLSAIVAAMLAVTGCQNTMTQSNQGAGVTSGQSANNQEPISYETLSRYNWTLISAVDSNNQPLSPLMAIQDQVELSFGQNNGQNRVGFSVGCNGMSGQYTLNNNVINLGNVTQTMMGCGNLDNAENLLKSLMQGSSQLDIKSDADAPLLFQITDNNVTLVWQGTLTPQAQYNQQGDTVFWEVSHTTQPCPDGSTNTCLKVRPVQYDAQGIKTSVGQWGLYNGTIQGYTHDNASDEILRLQRFVVNAPHVKGNQYTYVLDTVVESSVPVVEQ